MQFFTLLSQQASISGTNKRGRAEAGWGNKAIGQKVYAEGTGDTGKIGYETHGLGAKAGISAGYQGKTKVSNTHIDSQYGVGVNVESSIVPGNLK